MGVKREVEYKSRMHGRYLAIRVHKGGWGVPEQKEEV